MDLPSQQSRHQPLDLSQVEILQRREVERPSHHAEIRPARNRRRRGSAAASPRSRLHGAGRLPFAGDDGRIRIPDQDVRGDCQERSARRDQLHPPQPARSGNDRAVPFLHAEHRTDHRRIPPAPHAPRDSGHSGGDAQLLPLRGRVPLRYHRPPHAGTAPPSRSAARAPPGNRPRTGRHDPQGREVRHPHGLRNPAGRRSAPQPRPSFPLGRPEEIRRKRAVSQGSQETRRGGRRTALLQHRRWPVDDLRHGSQLLVPAAFRQLHDPAFHRARSKLHAQGPHQGSHALLFRPPHRQQLFRQQGDHADQGAADRLDQGGGGFSLRAEGAASGDEPPQPVAAAAGREPDFRREDHPLPQVRPYRPQQTGPPQRLRHGRHQRHHPSARQQLHPQDGRSAGHALHARPERPARSGRLRQGILPERRPAIPLRRAYLLQGFPHPPHAGCNLLHLRKAIKDGGAPASPLRLVRQTHQPRTCAPHRCSN